MDNIKETKNITLPNQVSSKYADVDGLSLQNLYYARFDKDCFPCCYLFEYDARNNGDYTFDTIKMYNHIREIYPKENLELSSYYTKVLGGDGKKDSMGFCLVLEKEKIMARFEKSVTDSYVLFDNEHYDEAMAFIEDILQFYIAPEETRDIYWKICSSQSGYYLDQGRIKCPKDFDVKKLYNDDFEKENKKICEFIEEEDKSGLVLLHGEKGTGKSSYIKYLVNKYPNRKFVYVPAHLVSMFGDPSFGSFITTLNNNIIVLEDCENVIKDRKINSSAAAVSLLLNLTDGILSDDLGMKFICTFNEDMKAIDDALLRKGRLVSKYEFKELCVEKSIEILKTRGIDNIMLKKPLTLAEIFHYGEDDYLNKTKPII